MTAKYADITELSEDERIAAIGKTCMAGNTVGVCLEANEPKKIKRYIKKVLARFPGLCVLQRIEGPTPLIVTIKFGKKPN